MDETPAADMEALTDKWISFRHIQHIVISVRSNKGHMRHNEMTGPLCAGNVFIISGETHLMRAMSSMRPPFPLYKLQALIPNLLLATDSKSDKVP